MLLVFLITGILLALVAQRILAEGRVPSAITILGAYLVGLLLFYSFTIEVAENGVRFWFGAGVLRRTIALGEIQSTQEVTNPWYYFWGIKSIPGGWLYAIAPGRAVEIVLADGRIVRLGTDQPRRLNQAIKAAKRRAGASDRRDMHDSNDSGED
jgi:hypothetical protein